MATMQEVADRAEVSIATVSFVVNGTKRVSPKTRERVEAAIAELGFQRNAMARALASRRSHVLALAFPLMERSLNDFVTGAAAAARAHGYTLVVWPVYNNSSAEVAALIGARSVDGVLLMEVQLDDPRVDRLVESDAPFVLIGRTRDPSALSWVDIDFETTARDSVDYLRSLGHRNISMVLESMSDTPLVGYGPPYRIAREFERIVATGEIDGHVFWCPRDPQAGRQVADEVFDQAPDTTAIIVMNVDASFGLVSGVQRRGLRIPEDVSVISVATTAKLSEFADPPLTAMIGPGEELGARAAEALIAKLEGKATEPAHLLISCELRVAQSTGPVRSTAAVRV